MSQPAAGGARRPRRPRRSLRRRLRIWLRRNISYRWARRIVVGTIGGTVLAAGVAMLMLPGPAIVVMPIGLAILGLEFAWARRWLQRLRATASGLVSGTRGETPPAPRQNGGGN